MSRSVRVSQETLQILRSFPGHSMNDKVTYVLDRAYRIEFRREELAHSKLTPAQQAKVLKEVFGV